MTSSDKVKKAEKIIDEIFKLADEGYLYHQIDGPIEKAFAGFELSRAVSVSHNNFLRLSGKLVSHIYEHGLTPSQKLSNSQARAEALDYRSVNNVIFKQRRPHPSCNAI